MAKMIGLYSWTTDKRTTEFYLHMDVEKWMAQNDAECLDIAEGCLLDHLVMACKRGTAFLFAESANTWSSVYHVYFIPYKDETDNPDYSALWDRFYAIQAMAEAEG